MWLGCGLTCAMSPELEAALGDVKTRARTLAPRLPLDLTHLQLRLQLEAVALLHSSCFRITTWERRLNFSDGRSLTTKLHMGVHSHLSRTGAVSAQSFARTVRTSPCKALQRRGLQDVAITRTGKPIIRTAAGRYGDTKYRAQYT